MLTYCKGLNNIDKSKGQSVTAALSFVDKLIRLSRFCQYNLPFTVAGSRIINLKKQRRCLTPATADLYDAGQTPVRVTNVYAARRCDLSEQSINGNSLKNVPVMQDLGYLHGVYAERETSTRALCLPLVRGFQYG